MSNRRRRRRSAWMTAAAMYAHDAGAGVGGAGVTYYYIGF